MTHFPVSDTRPAMGRPTLHVKPTVIRLSDGMAERIDAIAGKNRRAEFIREAIEAELKRRERTSAKPKPLTLAKRI